MPDNPRPYLASASADRTVRIWQPTIGRLVRFARLAHEPLCVAWTTDGSAILVGCVDGKVRALDPDTVQGIGEKQVFPGWVYSIAVSSSGKDMLIAGEGGQLTRTALPLQGGAKNE
jgi:WD40 repeat protein